MYFGEEKGLAEPSLDRVEDCLKAACDAELPEDLIYMALHRFLTDT